MWESDKSYELSPQQLSPPLPPPKKKEKKEKKRKKWRKEGTNEGRNISKTLNGNISKTLNVQWRISWNSTSWIIYSERQVLFIFPNFNLSQINTSLQTAPCGTPPTSGTTPIVIWGHCSCAWFSYQCQICRDWLSILVLWLWSMDHTVSGTDPDSKACKLRMLTLKGSFILTDHVSQ